MSVPTTALISLLFPGVITLTVDSSVGDHLALSCPSAGPPCGPACSWRGPRPHPHQVTFTSGENQSEGVRVSFNQSSCQCLLSIQNASVEHSGLWTCQLKQDGKIYSGATLDRKNIPHNKSEAFLDQPFIKDNQEGWKLSESFWQQEYFSLFAFYSLDKVAFFTNVFRNKIINLIMVGRYSGDYKLKC